MKLLRLLPVIRVHVSAVQVHHHLYQQLYYCSIPNTINKRQTTAQISLKRMLRFGETEIFDSYFLAYLTVQLPCPALPCLALPCLAGDDISRANIRPFPLLRFTFP